MTGATFGFGTMALAGADPTSARDLLERVVDAGITHFDTADVYGGGSVEESLAPFVARHRSSITITTKVGLAMPDGSSGLTRDRVIAATHASLDRLGVEYVDELLLHRPDPATPIEETLDAVGALLSNAIGSWGCSTLTGPMITTLVDAADDAHIARPVTEQSPLSILTRRRQVDVFPVVAELGMSVTAWSPLNGGWLTGKYRVGRTPPVDSRGATPGGFVDPADADKSVAVDALERLAASAGLDLAVMALAWTAAQPHVSTVLLAARTREQFDRLAPALHTRLDDDLLAGIDAIVAPGTTLDASNDAWPSPEVLTRRTDARPPL